MVSSKAKPSEVVTPEGGADWWPQTLSMPWLRGPLVETLTQHQGHALLLKAQAGDGALELSWWLALSWLCEGRAGPHEAACGVCDSCRQARHHTHPDLKILLPEALALAYGQPLDWDDKRKPSKQVKVEAVREAIDWMSSTSGRGRGKVLLIHPADTMNQISASALLKTLEEPPPGTRVVLSTAEPARLLPTVLSRCQHRTLHTPPADVAQAWLAEQGLAGEGAVLLSAAAGHPLQARQWAEQGLNAAQWNAVPEAVKVGQAEHFVAWPLVRTLDALQKLAHDSAALALGQPARFFPHAKLSRPQSLKAVLDWHRQLQHTAKHPDHPWNDGLWVEAMVAAGRALWAGKRSAGAR